jgi:hypothetical protein
VKAWTTPSQDSLQKYKIHVMECPCPKAFTGPHGWGPNKHWMVRDIVIRCVSGVCVSGVYVLAVRFKSIKQDRRIA